MKPSTIDQWMTQLDEKILSTNLLVDAAHYF